MNSTEHVINIINYLSAEREPRGVTEISKSLGSNKSSAYRILSTLKKAQWVEQDPSTKKYDLGVGLHEISASIMSGLTVRSISLPYLNKLCSGSGETAILSKRIGFERVYIEQIESSYEIRHIVEIGKRLPLWLGAPGKAILAHMEPAEVEMVIDDLRKSGVHILASGQILEVDQLLRELAEIRQKGFSMSFGERLVASAAVASPIFDRNHKVVGAISIAGPLPRFNQELAAKYAPLVSKAANEVSLRLGHMV